MELSHYKVIRIPKKHGIRIIHAPSEELKEKQREYLANEVRGRVRFPRGMTAFLPGRSILDAARPHVNKKYLVHVDIKDFFHHVTPYHILRSMDFEKFLPREIENRLIPLSGRDWHRIPPPHGLLDLAFIPSPKVPGEKCLPQGSPLSPYLSLLASKPIFFKVKKMLLTAHVDAAVTMYADGIYLSSDDKRVIPIGLHGVERILVGEGFRSNRRKFRIMRRGMAQRVCGLAVNQKLTVPKSKRREIRGRLHHLFMDAASGKDVDIREFRSVEGYFSFAMHMDPPWVLKYKPKLDYVRLYLKARKKIS